jgi:hypothetical protein
MAAYDRHLLLLDAAEGQLGRHAMELVELGVDVVYAQDADEAHLLARQDGARACAALFACPPDPGVAGQLVSRLAAALDGPPDAIAPIGPRPPAETLEVLRAAGLRFGLFDPLAFRELRFVASAVLRLGNAADPRKSDRFPTAIPARIKVGSREKDVRVHDLSRGGAWLVEPFPFPVETVLDVAFELDGTSFAAQAVIVGRRLEDDPTRPDAPAGMGIQFVEVDAANEDRLRAYIDACAEHYRL